MDDSSIMERIEQLVAEEHELLAHGEGAGADEERRQRLEELKLGLDRCWDLLRQRRAREEFGLDPDTVAPRDPETVEGYLQ